MLGCLAVGYQVHQPEPTRVVIADLVTVRELDDHVIVFVEGRPFVIEHAESPGHAQVRDENGSVLELEQKKFCPAAQTDNPPSRQYLPHIHRKWIPKAVAPERNAFDAAPFKKWRETPPYGLDFRKFRHSSGPGGQRMIPGPGNLAYPEGLGYGPAMPEKTPSNGTTTHFGYRDVAVDDKATLVKDVFDSVADKYDLMNDLMSLGIHRLWKNTMIRWLRPTADMTLVDVGGGTGDIAFRFLDAGGGTVSVVDANTAMLRRGRDRAVDRGILGGIEWITGDAECLPLDDASVDAYTIAFCIRNVTRMDQALCEAKRVLKPGGRFLCLEFSHLSFSALEKPYDLYSFKVLPWLGSQVAGDRKSYEYLAESIRQFLDQESFSEMISTAGLNRVTFRNLSGGIAAIHSAWRT